MAKNVYFAFHYEDVLNLRANVVRNHNLTKGAQKAGYYDASIWEESIKKGDLALKRMVNGELENTSVTAVLIGTATYARRWVRYELIKSVERGNHLIGIHINSIKGKDSATKPAGPNPFDYLGLQISDNGKSGQPTVWDGLKWTLYPDHGAFPILEQPVEKGGKHFQLSHWFRTYDWISDDGFNNFNTWVQ